MSGRWRVGKKIKRNLYCDNDPVAMLATDGQAEYIARQLAVKVIKRLTGALAEIEGRCGSSQSIASSTQQVKDIYDIARVALEEFGIPSSPL